MTQTEKRLRRQQIAERLALGDEMDAVCRHFGVTLRTAYDAATENGVIATRSPVHMSRLATLTLVRRMMEGGLNSELADEFGFAADTISKLRAIAIEAGFRFTKEST
jgi:hypothetical protein